jgi:hypothetical protein
MISRGAAENADNAKSQSSTEINAESAEEKRESAED